MNGTATWMMSYSPGDVVEVPFPFVDLPVRKRRPALVLSSKTLADKQGIVVLAMITSAKRAKWESDVALDDWQEAGLGAPSVVRWKIFTLDAALILARRGALSRGDRVRVAAVWKSVIPPLADREG
jgi:mRNA interferase MazF